MKLGIKTTGDIPRLKIKTTDDITKAVECACCNPCDPNALWGPGYDTKPETLDVLGHTIYRVGSCRWQIFSCLTQDGSVYWDADCNEDNDYYIWYISLMPSNYIGTPEPMLEYYMPDFQALYIRTGGVHPFPYGIYTLDSYYSPFTPEGPPTITISPPP